MYKSLTISALMLVITIAIPSFGHGTNKPGPHGGFIQMPGAFHTEVIQEGDQQWRVYFLDVNLKPVGTASSSVAASLEFGTEKESLKCSPHGAYFSCISSVGTASKASRIYFNVTFNKARGIASYPLPLKHGN